MPRIWSERRFGLFLPLVVAAWCWAPARATARPVWQTRTLTTRDGLAHNVVRDILEARDGSIWFATMGGLTRYSPRTCEYRTEAGLGNPLRREVMSLAEAADGALWVATRGGGVGRLWGDRWTWYTTRDGLPSDELTSLLIDRAGHIWATPVRGGLARFDGRGWQAVTAADGISPGEIGRCTELRTGAILCGTYDQPVLQRLDHGRWTQLSVNTPTRRHFYVHAATETRDGELWLATKGGGAIQGRLVDGSYVWSVHDAASGLAGNRVGAVRQAADGALWFATSAGVSRYDGRSFQTLTRKDGLGSDQVFAITQTRDGALWFATLGGGATRYAQSRWSQITEHEGLASDNVTGGLLLTRDGSLWAGTDQGLSVFREARWSSLRTEAPGRDYINHLLQSSSGAIWVATRQGLRHFDRDRPDSWREHVPVPGGVAGPAHPVIHRVAEDARRRIWVATAGGVSVTEDGSRWRTYAVPDGLPSAVVNDVLVEKSGRVWVATDNGVGRLEPDGRWTAFLNPAPSSRANRIYSLALQEGGAIWASGLEGVHRLEGDDWRPVPPDAWLPAGLYSRFVMSTPDGSLWFAVRGLGVKRLRAGRWTAFSSADGLGSDTVVDVKQLRDGELIFATLGGGISRYRPEANAPETHMGSGLWARPVEIPSSVLQGEGLLLSYSGQDVLKETETRDLLYSHRVDGAVWSPFTADTRAYLTGIGAGRHVFEVRAMDQDGNIDPTPARHVFRVIRPWWAEPWLLALFGLTVALALAAAVRLVRAVHRERVAITREQGTLAQRRQFVRLAAHELRQPLARVAHRAEMLTEPSMLKDHAKLAEYAQAISDDAQGLARLVQNLLEQARLEEGIRLELGPGDLSQLVQRVAGEFSTRPESSAIRVRLSPDPLPVSLDPFYLPLAIRNLVDNALKYAAALGEIEVITERSGDRARLSVRDHGPGIPDEERERIFEPFFRGRSRPSSEHGGFGLGLSFARDIARAHGGDLWLEATSPGSTFCLALPLRTAARDQTPGTEERDGATADHR